MKHLTIFTPIPSQIVIVYIVKVIKIDFVLFLVIIILLFIVIEMPTSMFHQQIVRKLSHNLKSILVPTWIVKVQNQNLGEKSSFLLLFCFRLF